ncbi:MAG TPA: helix-turn-helix transcriptional regulator [Pyrinomonadaceae bacterium]|nr:helix-turn-helix transcriptional regulator [Pyrinomonadaceae bacterium]
MDLRIQKALALMHERMNLNNSPILLAQEVNLSESRFRHLFKNETGMSPTQCLKQMRMREARRLLDETFLTIKQVRLRVGINDKKQFSTDFKKTYGCSPACYVARRRDSTHFTTPEDRFNRTAKITTK